MLKRAPYDPLLQCPSQNSFSLLKLGFNQLFSKQATCPQAEKPCLLNQAFAQVNLDLLLDFVGLCWAESLCESCETVKLSALPQLQMPQEGALTTCLLWSLKILQARRFFFE